MPRHRYNGHAARRTGGRVLILNNSIVVILVSVRRGVPEESRSPTPLYADGFFVPRDDFERAWAGHVLILTPLILLICSYVNDFRVAKTM
jgi:hypothetical protein